MQTRFCTRTIVHPLIATATAVVLSAAAHAAEMRSGGHGSGHGNAMTGQGHAASVAEIGMPGKAADATRTVEITMTDNRYSTENLSVTKGETIRFVIKNKGELVHEFNIGTPKMHTRHQKNMEMMVEHGVLEADRINYARMKMDMGGGKTMEHNDPNSALLEPGKNAEIVWKFTHNADLEFACNVPGHYDAGMAGKLHVK